MRLILIAMVVFVSKLSNKAQVLPELPKVKFASLWAKKIPFKLDLNYELPKFFIIIILNIRLYIILVFMRIFTHIYFTIS